MPEYSLKELAERMQGTVLQGNPELCFRHFNIDSRLTQPGELFFAIQAERNGHDFVPHAVQQGAAGVVICQPVPYPVDHIALIRVDNTLEALQALAAKTAADIHPRVIGITGSIGKTSTKEFTAHLLSPSYSVLKSEGNYNNHLGLPLSLLRLEEHHQIAVLEYGMSAAGEITALTRIVSPDMALITNVNPVHLEFFPDIHAIARAKQELLAGANSSGFAILNGDDQLVKDMAGSWPGETLFFGLSQQNRIRAEGIQDQGWKGTSFDLIYGDESHQAQLPLFNRGQLYNFLAAAAAAFVVDIPLPEIVQRAAGLKALGNRGQVYILEHNIRIIDDSYNSNPAALELALASLADLPGKRKVAILGDMLELGNQGRAFHRRAGEYAVKAGIDLLITVGPLSSEMAEAAVSAGMDPKQVRHYKTSLEAAEDLSSSLQRDDVLLIKGSRGIRMDTIVQKLCRKEG